MVSKFIGGSLHVNRDGHIGIRYLMAKVTGNTKNLQQQNEKQVEGCKTQLRDL